jgi:hypothetical protein
MLLKSQSDYSSYLLSVYNVLDTVNALKVLAYIFFTSLRCTYIFIPILHLWKLRLERIWKLPKV